MNDENLIPKDLSKKPYNHHELSVKGGKAKSKAKTLANQIKGFKIAKPENQDQIIHKIITDPEFSLRHIGQLISNLPKDRHVADLWLKTHKAAHGEKQHIEIKGQLDVITTVKQWMTPKNTNQINGPSSKASITNATPPNDASTKAPPDSES